jgi:uncharacterized RDD family membrane protein YckC
MICATCHGELLDDAAFCNRCGAKVRRVRVGVRYAGFWRRVLAVVIDLVLLAPAIQFGKEFFYLTQWRWDQQGMLELADPTTQAEREETAVVMAKQMAAFGTLIFFVAMPYYVLTESSALQGTLGKRILGLKVTGLNGERIRLGRAFVRYWARMISAMPWQFGFVMAAFTSKKQALHDMLAKTLVVRENPAEEMELPRATAGAVCPNCSHELFGGAAFCNSCGAAVRLQRPVARYAGFGRRAMALVLDLLILTPVMVILLKRFPPISPEEFRTMLEIRGDRLSNSERTDVNLMITERFLYLCALVFGVSGAYSVLTESSALQGTLGKRGLGVKVTDMNGRRIRFGRAVGRYLAHILSTSLWLAGFIMAAFTARRQALHDILAGTLVVEAG